jgi:hypothetical protein
MRYLTVIPIIILFVSIMCIGILFVCEGLKSRNMRHSLVSTTKNRALYGKGKDRIIEGVALLFFGLVLLGVIAKYLFE